MKVHFNEPSEFCDELEKDKLKVDRGIVRTTFRFEPSKLSPNIHHVFALASYSVDGQVVEMEKYCGDTWGLHTGEDEKVHDRANNYIKTVESACQLCKLEMRAGTLEE